MIVSCETFTIFKNYGSDKGIYLIGFEPQKMFHVKHRFLINVFKMLISDNVSCETKSALDLRALVLNTVNQKFG